MLNLVPVTTQDTYNSAFDAVKDIDQELSQINESARTLRSRRNALAPISTLPPELLSTIFEYTVSPDLAWIAVTQTCRRWRAVAFGSAKLWSDVRLSRPKWAKEMLKRSRGAPIHIEGDLSFPTPRLLDVLQATLEHTHRTRSLRITAFHSTLHSVASTLEKGAPLLQSLTLRNSLRNGFALDVGMMIPPTMSAPQLRRLELQKCNIEWSSPFLQHLTSFKLHDASRPSAFELLTALQAMPHLKVLDLRNCLPLATDYTKLPVVPLNQLTDVTLRDTLESCSAFFAHVSYPHPVSIDMDCTCWEGDDKTFLGCLDLLCRVPAQLVLGLELVQEGPTSVSIVVSDSPSLRATTGRTRTSLSLALRWASELNVSPSQLMLHCCKLLKLTHLRTLRYHQAQEPEPSLWTDCISHLPKLQNVVASGVPINSFVESLHPRRSPRLSASRSNNFAGSCTAFRGLEKVTLQRGVFTGSTSGRTLLSNLHDALRSRAERDLGVSKLSFEWCVGLGDRDIAAFHGVVQGVIWDGLELIMDSDDDEGPFYDSDDE
ncbi:hypothetical protein ONZ45_g2031 [Pleurotus djamor]|nr:hypothetical protein ONZ45_g2031 [Pleurotus djamor]